MSKIQTLLLAMIWLYQRTIRPLIGPSCRFAPSCSEYAQDAIRVHGAVHGTQLLVRRLSRCHPWTSGGYDPVSLERW